jgi:hypothetical protein
VVSFSGTEARTGRVENSIHELMLKHLEKEHVQKLEFNQEILSLKLKFLRVQQEIKLKLLQEK